MEASMVNLDDIAWDPVEFEKTWIACVEKIVTAIMADLDIQQIKVEVRSQRHVTAEHKDQFITKVNEIKNHYIEDVFGKPGSDTYKQFVHAWQHWLKLKGKNRPQGENMFEDNINHLLYGSTPDPDLFLRDFDIYTDI
jgi:undecaprenyl pyrophosphate synthase